MSVLRSKNEKELLINCDCGCDSGILFRIDKEDNVGYFFMTYISSRWYSEQGFGTWTTFYTKLKKIWRIIRNKDHHYTETFLTKADFEEFREYINSI